MTTPTQAQIEAAAKVISANTGASELVRGSIYDLAKAALTAAAQVSEVRAQKADASDVQTHRPLTAAQAKSGMGLHNPTPRSDQRDAQVGELDEAEKFQDLLDAQHKRSVAATIERCAQVAELYRDAMPDAGCCHRHKTNIAAAIRKLKDEP